MRTATIVTWALLMTTHSLFAQAQTRGIGVYPGDPAEYTGPILQPDSTAVRNIAQRRPAYHSSSYDYNLTAQLVTDGVVETTPPAWLVTAIGQRGLVSEDVRDLPRDVAADPLVGLWRRQLVLPKHQREHLVDGNWVSGVDLKGTQVWVQIERHGGGAPPPVDRVDVIASVDGVGSAGPENWTMTWLGSDTGDSWTPLGHTSGMTTRGGDITPRIDLQTATPHRYYRLVFDNPRAIGWRVSDVRFSKAGAFVPVGGPYRFTSAWMSEGRGREWVSVDLGAGSTFDRITLHWIARALEGVIEVSDDQQTWKTVARLPSATTPVVDDIRLPKPVTARFVRALLTKPPVSGRYILSEFEVFGRGGQVARAQAQPAPRPNGRLDLTGGRWKLQRESWVKGDGPTLATVGYADHDWVVATVPGTILTSYLNAGAIPDPNVGDNQLMVSDAFFYSDFWYRTEFVAPPAGGRRQWLNLDGVNWNADVYLNGARIGRVLGGFARSRFDVTGRLREGQLNAVAIRVEKNASPGSIKEKTFDHPDLNGGALGADNPTFHASVGWDWIPTIRGRNTGIWNDVYLTGSGPVTVTRPLVRTTLPLPKTDSADVVIATTLTNHEQAAVSGTVRATFGEIVVERALTLSAGESRVVTFDPTTDAALRVAHPRLWWPNGYGDQARYPVELSFRTAAGIVSDRTSFLAGIRQFTHTMAGHTLRMWINGRRFVPRGGNWGFSESMLRYRRREYDAAVRYHRDLNFTMIRNWVGQTGDDEFFDACDRYGIVVWQDFWLANPWDGPDPDHAETFLSNASDLVDLARTHPSVGLYCGRNEGYPSKPLDDAIRSLLAASHPDVPYISSSADDVASGHGPYQAQPVPYYFTSRATPKIHGEMGMPNIVTLDSLALMIPESGRWPLGRMYGLHDFSLDGAQGGRGFLARMQKAFGMFEGVTDFVSLAQFVNYDGYRAMFEAQSRHRMGLLLWMSHPAWPSLVWQTYDYYFDQSAGYYGAKKGAEPLHVQWNPTTESVEVVNYHAGDREDLTVTARVFTIDGDEAWTKTVTVDSPEDSTQSAIVLEYPLGLTPVHFLRLELRQGPARLSENFYWRSLDEQSLQPLRALPAVPVTATSDVQHDGSTWRIRTTLQNTGTTPALMVRVKAVRSISLDRVLPAIYSDNYVALMPGERREIMIEMADADTRGERPAVVVEGFNVLPAGARR